MMFDGLRIAMHEPAPMCLAQAAPDLARQANAVFDAHAPARTKALRQSLAAQVLHRHEVRLIGHLGDLPVFEQRHDVRMRQLREDRRLLQEAPPEAVSRLRVAAVHAAQHLDRDGAIERLLRREVDARHAAARDAIDDLEAAANHRPHQGIECGRVAPGVCVTCHHPFSLVASEFSYLGFSADSKAFFAEHALQEVMAIHHSRKVYSLTNGSENKCSGAYLEGFATQTCKKRETRGRSDRRFRLATGPDLLATWPNQIASRLS
ncbi:MAG: hypothetical protein QM756_24840 [Polyangiaceae bacterium]